MTKTITVLALTLTIAPSLAAQKKPLPWTEWSKKDVEKILNNSAWAQTQTEGESQDSGSTSAITAVAAPRSSGSDLSRTGESGESKPSQIVKYRIRFLTAKPVREAFARMVLLSQEKANEELTQKLQGFVDRDFGDYIVIAVAFETADKRVVGPLMQAFSSANAEVLKSTAYLERKDGKRVFLMDYRAPVNDGMGAKLVFPRTLEGQPFLKDESDNIRFVAEFNQKIKLNTRYKVADMTYDGRLEY